MAENIVTGASLTPIYGKLNAIENHHPLDAETFSDWAVEAGDIVTIQRDGEDYQSPVHTSRMVWKGQPEMRISSTGNKVRDPIAKISKKKYGRGGAGQRNDVRLYNEMTSSDGYFHSYILQTESVLISHFDNALSDIHSEIRQTAEEIRSEIHGVDSIFYSYVDQTATYIMSHVENVASSIGSEILQTANEIRSEVHAANSTLYSYVDQTATSIHSVVESVESRMGSSILQTANEIRSEVHAANSELYSYVDQTATYIQSVVENTANNLGSAILQTASQIRSEVHAANSELYSYVDQTATSIHSVVESVESRMGSSILQTANEIRSEVHAADSSLYSFVLQTATSLSSAIVSTESRIGSSIQQTANSIRTDVYAANSTLYSYVNQTAGELSSAVVSAESRMGSSIQQTAGAIRAEVSAGDNSVRSYVLATASQIRSEVSNTVGGLQSSINQQADKIGLLVEGTGSNAHINAAQIVAEINAAGSNVLIEADKIKLSGDTTVDGAMSITSGNLIVKKYSVFNQGAIIGNGYYLSVPSAASVLFGRSNYGSSIELTGDILSSMIRSFSIDQQTNTLTLVRMDGTSENFSKATPGGQLIGGSWSGNVLTVAQSDEGSEAFSTSITPTFIQVNDVSSPTRYFITAYRQDNQAEYPTEISAARVEYKLGVISASKYVVRILNGAGTGFLSDTPSYTIPTETLTVTENGTYTPTGNNVGYSTVTVNIPSDLANARANFGYNQNANNYYVNAIDSRDSHEISGSMTYYHLGISGTTVNIYNANNVRIPNTHTLTIPLQTLTTNTPGTYTPSTGMVGYSSVTVTEMEPTVNTWALTFQNNSSYSYNASVKINGTTYTSGTLNASDAFANGWSACYEGIDINPTSFSSLNYGQTYTVYARAYMSNNAQSRTNVASVSFTVPADRYQTGYDAGVSAGQLTGWSNAYGKVVWPGSNTSTATMTVKVPASSASSSPNQTSRDFTVSVDNNYGYIMYGSTTVARVSHSIYSSGQANGWSQAYNKVSWPGSNTSSASMVIKIPASGITSNPQQNEKTFTVSVDSNYAYIKTGSTTVARVAHSYKYTTDQYNARYSAGVNDGYGACHTSIELSPSSFGTLAYSTTYTVEARAYPSSSATSKTRAKALTFTTPSDRYNSGYSAGQTAAWNAAYGNVSWPSASTADMITVSAPGSGYGTTDTKYYTLSVDASYVYLKTGSTTVARKSHSYNYTSSDYSAYGTARYNAGVTAGYSGCFSSISLVPSSINNISYDTTYTIKAYANSTPNSNNEAASMSFTTPSYWSAFDAGWLKYYDVWTATYQMSGGKYTYPARTPIPHNNSNYNIVWSGTVTGSGSGSTSGSGTTTYANSVTLYCSNITTNNNGVKTVTFTVNYSASQNVPFTKSKSYNFHY